MRKVQRIHRTLFWDKRDNLVNKPSLSYRSIEVIQHMMENENLNLGLAIEKLITSSPHYSKILNELSEDFPDINI